MLNVNIQNHGYRGYIARAVRMMNSVHQVLESWSLGVLVRMITAPSVPGAAARMCTQAFRDRMTHGG
jgi:hypothetical protein